MGDAGSTSEYDSEHPEDKVSFATEFPKISQTLKDFKLIEGSDVTFVCKISGKPRPKIAWYKDGVRVKRSQRVDMKYTHDGYCTLKIKTALKEDAGHYTVLAVNSSGRDTCSAELFIDVKGIDSSSFVQPETLVRQKIQERVEFMNQAPSLYSRKYQIVRKYVKVRQCDLIALLLADHTLKLLGIKMMLSFTLM